MDMQEDSEFVAALVSLATAIGVGSTEHITMAAVHAEAQTCDSTLARERLSIAFNEVRGMFGDPSVFGPIRDFIVARDVLTKMEAVAQ